MGDIVKVVYDSDMEDEWGEEYMDSIGKTLEITKTPRNGFYILDDNRYGTNYTEQSVIRAEITNWKGEL